MTWQALIMYGVSLVAGVTGAVLLLRLRTAGSEGAVYAYRIAGTMLAALGLVLAIFASAQWSWNTNP
ncbi:hypothetical protein [Sphingomonas sp. 3-13AW]|jgi:hypothetical protein|uniref:hypothetical protein n=1 Tax=Sphingomonas sp. 3-13AW TaxID=3050450 RepID=UPI003BB50E51